jgi:hypothetical protein
MVSLTCHTRSVGDVTLVELSLTAQTTTRVRVTNRLDGSVWPPRTQGVPAEGWDDDGFEGVVDDRLLLGYASPAPAKSPPVELTETTPAEGGDTPPTPQDIVRSLGDARPPRDAVGRPAASATRPDDDDQNSPQSPPPAVTDWLDAVETRLQAADRLAQASSVADASEAVAAVGGAEDVRSLREQLAVDRQALARVQNRADALADRAERVEIPVETLTRLA